MNNSKYDAVTVLYRRTIDKIKASPQEWQNFIKSVAYNYKLSFDDKVLLYAQRPNAKAVLELNQWNKIFGRVVTKGVKGIAVFNNIPLRHSLKYYFDISDTLPTNHSVDVPIWEINNDNYHIVTDYFRSNFDYNDDITVTIQNAVNSLSSDVINDYLDNNDNEFKSYTKDNLLSPLKEVVNNSSSLLIAERLGINKNDFYDSDFEFISNCSHKEINIIGNIVTDVSSGILSDISKLVLLDNRRKSYDNSEGQEQRTNLHSARGLSSTEPSIGNETGTRKVRRDEILVSEGKEEDNLHRVIDNGQVERTSTENSRPSKSESGTLSQTDGDRGTSDRGTESERPNEVGSVDEQHQEQSRGSSGEGNSLQLTDTIKPLIEYNEQINSIEQEAEEQINSSAFSFTHNDNDIPEEVITSIIQYGSSIENSKFRIYEQFQKSLSKKENADFLKNEYGSGGVYPFAVTSTYSSYLEFDSRGIHIDYEPNDGNRISVTLKWNEVEKRVSELILTDKYLSPNEMDKYVEKTLADKIETENKNNNIKNKDYSFDYQLLDRLRSDCRYYLDGHRNPDLLWAGSVEEQIKEMRKLYNSFPSDKKPQWITEEDINHFEAEMLKDNNINIDLENNSAEYEYSYKQGDIVHINSMDFVVRSVDGDNVVITGEGPVSVIGNYQAEVNAYTKGTGRLALKMAGYRPCHNTEEVIEKFGYEPERDTRNPVDSVFCAGGSGYVVPWNEVREHAHVEIAVTDSGVAGGQSDREVKLTAKQASRTVSDEWIGTDEVDRILNETYFSNSRGDNERRKLSKRKADTAVGRYVTGGNANVKNPPKAPEYNPDKKSFLLVDGYNIIHAFKELSELAQVNLDSARGRLLDILCNYQAMKGCELIVVFDAYRVPGHDEEFIDFHNIHVVFTKTAETADHYIEKFAHENGKKYNVTVATSDGVEQVIIRGQGCLLISAREFEKEIAAMEEHLRENYLNKTY